MSYQENDVNDNRVIIKDRELTYEVNEEMKVLRTNIQFSGADTKVIVMTSCIGGEGKSTTSMNLAISLAELHKKVILIDADLRKSVMERNLMGGAGKKVLHISFPDRLCVFSHIRKKRKRKRGGKKFQMILLFKLFFVIKPECMNSLWNIKKH